jgi:hypothetical protein
VSVVMIWPPPLMLPHPAGRRRETSISLALAAYAGTAALDLGRRTA